MFSEACTGAMQVGYMSKSLESDTKTQLLIEFLCGNYEKGTIGKKRVILRNGEP